jgi:hypothetical protein
MPTETSGRIEFLESHRPVVPLGDYTVSVTQEISAKNIKSDNKFTATRNFSVLGPRFILDPQEIEAAFPPPGSLGDHANVLPHLILRRSTLPWERVVVPMEQRDNQDVTKKEEEKQIPWLALLLFDEEEVKMAKVTTPLSLSLSDLKKQMGNQIPRWQPEPGDQEDDTLTVIDVDKTLLQAIMPTKADLKFLAHVRQTKDATGKPAGEEVAVIIGGRLPKGGKMSTVHLVSLEGRYLATGDFAYPTTGDKVRLVSLNSWRFACVDSRQSFKGLLMHLNQPSLFNIKDDRISTALNQEQIVDALKQAFAQTEHALERSVTIDRVQWKIVDNTRYYLISNALNVYNQAGKMLFKLTAPPVVPIDPTFKKPFPIDPALKGTFRRENYGLSDEAEIENSKPDRWWINSNQYSIVQDADRLYVYYLGTDSSSTLRLPRFKSDDQISSKAAESYFKMGCVPLSHAMRQGNKTVSWYHGPLVPGSNSTPNDISLPVRSADDLVRYNATHGMFDVSYAAAWQLGRLLALQSKSFSVSLYNWKRSHAQKIKDAEQQIAHLRLEGPAPSLDLPRSVSTWFEHLLLLEGVPFNYLVPDERLLPPESIRFFQLDPMWMECLMDGAFSIGRVLKTDHERDRSHRNQDSVNVSSPEKVSGFLLRSDVVAGWPGLQVDGYDEIPPNTSDLKKTFLFDLKNLEFKKEGLSHKDILVEVQKELAAKKQLFSVEKATVENQQWSIFSNKGDLQYRLNKRENNEIDICTVDDKQFLFSIDIGSETNLTAGKLTADLQQAFQARTQNKISSDSVISVTGWFVSDNKNHKHYWIETEGTEIEGATCKVYRQCKLPLLRMAALSRNVLICLFDGIVDAIDLHLKPETLHFGVDVDGETKSLFKKLRDTQGKENSSFSIPVPQKGATCQVINIAQMADHIEKELNKKNPKLSAFTSAEFALQMIEGVEKVRFTQ